jgi:hypothetical protein
MIEWASSGGVKVERANQQISNLETEISAFLKREPYEVVAQEDAQSRLTLYRAYIRERPKLIWGAIAGEILHDLRSSLDILWRGAWYPEGGGSGDTKIEFPIFDTADKLERRYPHDRFVKGTRKRAVDLVNAAKPYKGGNDLLWMLHVANAADKHRLLIPAYASIPSARVSIGGPADWMRLFPMSIHVTLGDPVCPVEDGAIFFYWPLDDPTHVDVNPEPALDIAFGEVEPIKGKPIVSTLNKIANKVDGIAESFIRAGLLK